LQLACRSAPPFTDPTFGRYLERYAEPEARVAFATLSGPGGVALGERYWGAVLIVPVLGEAASFLDGYRAACQNARGRTLLVVVLNAHERAGEVMRTANAELVRVFAERFHGWISLGAGSNARLASGGDFDLLLIERWQAASTLPSAGAVGHARKLGNDVALVLMTLGKVRSPWLHQSDADAVLPQDAFGRDYGVDEGARLFAFRHVAQWGSADAERDAVELATLQYEVQLRYHVLGLRWAGSPYAFHALGSCVAVHARSYVHVRGFPKRAAGEDFYLLQKVRKLAPVVQWAGAPVLLWSRVSSRTPFGTGVATQALLRGDESSLDAPANYDLLRDWLARVSAYSEARDTAALGLDAPRGTAAGESARQALLCLGAGERLLALLGEATSGADVLRRAHTWFDGLKTQRLLHMLRRDCPMVSARVALEGAPFAGASSVLGPGVAHWRALRDRLAALEGA
jgi:hypothetical protein